MSKDRTEPSYQAPGVFTAKIRRFIEHFLDTSDITKAAHLVGMDPGDARDIFSRPEVKAEIDRREDEQQGLLAALRAGARQLQVDFLDDQLVVAVKAGAAEGDVKAVTLGYERLGLRRDKNFMTAAQSTQQERPQVYSVLEQTVTTKVTQVGAPPQQPQLPKKSAAPPVVTIEGGDIEDY